MTDTNDSKRDVSIMCEMIRNTPDYCKRLIVYSQIFIPLNHLHAVNMAKNSQNGISVKLP